MGARDGALVEPVGVPFIARSGRHALITLTELSRCHAEEHEADFRRLYIEELARSAWRRSEQGREVRLTAPPVS